MVSKHRSNQAPAGKARFRRAWMIGRSWRAVALGGLFLLLAVGCSSDDANNSALPSGLSGANEEGNAGKDVANPQSESNDEEEVDWDFSDFEFEPVIGEIGLAAANVPSADRLAAADVSELELADTDLESVMAAYEMFLDARDRARRGGEDEFAQLSALTTSDAVLVDVEQVRSEFGQSRDLGLEMNEFSNITHPVRISGDPEAVEILDCLEERVAASFVGLGTTNFVDHAVVMERRSDGGWVVVELDQRHSGFWEEGPSCTPPLYEPIVHGAASEFLASYDMLLATPEAPIDELEKVTDFDVFMQVVESLQRMAEFNVHLPQPQEHSVEVLGSHPGYGSTWFLVGVCTRLTKGLLPVDRTTGLPVPIDDGDFALAAGHMYRELLVLLETDSDSQIVGKVAGIDDQIFDADCGNS